MTTHCRPDNLDEITMAARAALAASAGQYHQAVILVGLPPQQVDALAGELGASVVAVGAALAGRLIEEPVRSRPWAATRVLGEVIAESAPHPVLLHHIEVLFEPALQADPMAMLRQLSRDRPIIVIWPGQLDGDDLVYANPGHPEYRRDSAKDLMVVAANAQGTTA